MIPRPTLKQLEALKNFGAATVHEAQNQKGALDAGIKALNPASRLTGPAFTVDARPGDNLIIHYALTMAQPGDVLVVDAKGFQEGGAWGDLLTLAAQQLGIAGLVIDGAIRDSAAIIEMGFPIFSRGLSIKGTLKNQPGHINIPIICGGMAIHPGDVIVGDGDGLVVIPAQRLDEVIAAAEEREAKEDTIRVHIREGRSTVDILGLQPILQHLGLK